MGLLTEGTPVAVRWQRGNLTGIALMFPRFRGILCSRSSILSRPVPISSYRYCPNVRVPHEHTMAQRSTRYQYNG